MKSKLEARKLYTSKQICKIEGLRTFQDLLVNGRIEWITDNSEGNKLYRIKQLLFKPLFREGDKMRTPEQLNIEVSTIGSHNNYKDKAMELLSYVNGYSWDKELQKKHIETLKVYLSELKRARLVLYINKRV